MVNREAQHCRLIDATLREGLQAPNVFFSLEDSMAIAKQIVQSGAEMIEVGHPSASVDTMKKVMYIAGMGLDVPVLAHARAFEKDIHAVFESGAGWVGIFIGVNEISESARLGGRNFNQLLEKIHTSVLYAKSLGLMVRFTVEDSSRTTWSRMTQAYQTAIKAGTDRICFADSVGNMEPKAVESIVSKLKKTYPLVELEVHFHNDRGLSIANSLVAADAGADWISVSVNGLGERCGITDHAIFAANLLFRKTRPLSRIQSLMLEEASYSVIQCSGQAIAKSHPVLGEYAFTHTSRLHVLAVKKDTNSYEWIDPKRLGRTHTTAPISNNSINSISFTKLNQTTGNKMSNSKATAWDNIGSLFWEQGRKSAKPSAYEMDLFTKRIQSHDRVCVIGASTKELICLLIDRGVKVTVYDFSQGMCAALRAVIPNPEVVIEHLDICAPLDRKKIASQDFVLSDRLINRFNSSEFEKALRNMCALAEAGEVRTSIKLGFYPMDLNMIKLGKERGTLKDFFNAKTTTIDFSKANNILDDALLEHGDIDKNLLLKWYRGRGAEKRFEHEEIVSLASQILTLNGRPLEIVEVDAFPDAISTNLYTLCSR